MEWLELFSAEAVQQAAEWMMPCQPIRWENTVPVYTSQQINLYGLPDHWVGKG
jgi:hypothetical protein